MTAVDAKAILASMPVTTGRVAWNRRDLILYALGVGAPELKFTYELDKDFSALPFYPLCVGAKGESSDVVKFGAARAWPKLPGVTLDINKLLHGEQSIEILKPIPLEGSFKAVSRTSGIYDLGKATVITNESIYYDKDDTPLVKLEGSSFIRDAGGWGGPRRPKDPRDVDPPKDRKPDKVETHYISPQQAMLYRLSGDYNPLHADPAIATSVGFKAPILHGLCTYGHCSRAILKAWGDNDSRRFKSIRGRFLSPVYPGETLEHKMWLVKSDANELTVAFQTKIKDRNIPCLSGSAVVKTGGARL
ncbi:Thioesterase/thiol ester dehydrase-isomerase [Gonapodya prolifera JEL478]|uniref:Thioesterase/thiol ester dehydrase-isomerase n=1 Tax=Gonapodya prolifera (strain JEL478) TaxID=1344416 RepID=A0A139AAG9_GONPJ|nr:Thioesterase/thiol ester dehydrase-isomerase [Gonapodya prolifera JEL478]|eukprot:KXS13495.1 Thioesterase/thiol ester dehydrase-isomerase [Gonapodya prolifera JEL478]